jgi:hypothetical protein
MNGKERLITLEKDQLTYPKRNSLTRNIDVYLIGVQFIENWIRSCPMDFSHDISCFSINVVPRSHILCSSLYFKHDHLIVLNFISFFRANPLDGIPTATSLRLLVYATW